MDYKTISINLLTAMMGAVAFLILEHGNKNGMIAIIGLATIFTWIGFSIGITLQTPPTADKERTGKRIRLLD